MSRALVAAVRRVGALAGSDGLVARVVPGVALADGHVAVDGDALEVGAVAVVRVDADERLTRARGDVLQDDVPRVLARAVAARAVELVEVFGGEVLNRERAAAVVLKDLVGGALRAAAAHGHRLRARAAVERWRRLRPRLPTRRFRGCSCRGNARRRPPGFR